MYINNKRRKKRNTKEGERQSEHQVEGGENMRVLGLCIFKMCIQDPVPEGTPGLRQRAAPLPGHQSPFPDLRSPSAGEIGRQTLLLSEMNLRRD